MNRVIPGLSRRNLGRELLAGVTLIAIAIPINIGYAQIAGLPPTAGLYALVLPTIVWVVLTSSRQLVASPDASAAALVAASIGGLAAAGSQNYATMALAQAVICGVLFLAMAVFKLGFLANFLSRPILVGFIAGLALDVFVSQVAKMLGVHIDSGSEFTTKLLTLARGLGTANLWSIVIAAGAILVLILGRKLLPAVPWALIVLVVSTAAVTLTHAPVAVVATWAHRELTDTSYFVSTFAPLAEDPAVQDFITDEAVEAIEAHLDIDQIADDLFAGLEGLDIGPRGQAALGLLQAPAVSGVKGLIESTVTTLVQSEAFATIWEDALTVTHKQLVNTATGQQNAAITVGADQQISVQLGPIIEAVKEQLLVDGFTLADQIPAVDRSIVIVQDSSVGTYLTIYHTVVAVGLWLPWIVLLLLAAGVLVAPRRAAALAWAGGAALITMVLASKGVDIGANLVALAAAEVIPHDTTVAAEHLGMTTGSFGRWLQRWRRPLRLAVGAVASAYILFVRPMTPEVIMTTAILGIGAVIILEVLARPPAAPAPALHELPTESAELKESLA